MRSVNKNSGDNIEGYSICEQIDHENSGSNELYAAWTVNELAEFSKYNEHKFNNNFKPFFRKDIRRN